MFPISAPPLRNGVVTIAGDRIVAVGENRSGRPAVDLGDVAMLPGLVNPHTHLEFSHLARPLGHRRDAISRLDTEPWFAAGARPRARSTRTAVARTSARHSSPDSSECLAHGVTTVGDIVTTDLDDVSWYPVAGHAGMHFEKCWARPPDAVAQQLDSAHRHLQQVARSAGHPGGLESARSLQYRARTGRNWRVDCRASTCVRWRCTWRSHRKNCSCWRRARGPLRDSLEQLGAWHPQRLPGGSQPRDYLELLDTAHRCLVIHGNYLAANGLGVISRSAPSGWRSSIVRARTTISGTSRTRWPLCCAAAYVSSWARTVAHPTRT